MADNSVTLAEPIDGDVPSGDALTPAELAYMESGGENADALIAENGGTKVEPEAKPDAEAKPAPKPAADAKVDAKADPKAETTETPDDDTAADIASSDPQQKPPTRVSYHKFKRTEDRLKATDRELADLREKYARGDERLKLLAEALTVTQPKEGAVEEDPKPDIEQDLYGYIKWQDRQIDRLGKQLEGTRGEIGQTRETIQQRDEADGMKSTFQQDAVRFSQAAPDFLHAYNHLLNVRAGTLEDQGYSPDQIQKFLATEERGLVKRALEANKSPAEMIYAMAQRFGYRKADAPALNGATQDGATAAEAKPAANGGSQNGKPTAAEILANVQKGQAAGKTLSGTGGTSSPLSAESLANMSEAEFNELLRSKPKQVEAIMGKLH